VTPRSWITAGWIGVAGHRGGIGFAAMMQAGLNVAVPALFILGVGTLLYGLLPRLAAPILYTLILWSFLIEIIGPTITSNHLASLSLARVLSRTWTRSRRHHGRQ